MQAYTKYTIHLNYNNYKNKSTKLCCSWYTTPNLNTVDVV